MVGFCILLCSAFKQRRIEVKRVKIQKNYTNLIGEQNRDCQRSFVRPFMTQGSAAQREIISRRAEHNNEKMGKGISPSCHILGEYNGNDALQAGS